MPRMLIRRDIHPIMPSIREYLMIPKVSCVNRQQQPLVLAVEDNEDNLLLISYVVESLGYRLLGETSGVSTLQIVKQYQPNLILMDIMLPDVNGIDIFYQLQQDPLTSSIPVVAMTALAMAQEQKQIQKAGFHGYIIKPYMLEDLEHMILSHLEPTGTSSKSKVIMQYV
ncbi:MAG: response regulator [Cyanobacteria bacterium P01_A01_bin.68]